MLKRLSLSVVGLIAFTLLIAGVSLAHAKSCDDDSLESVSDDGSILKMFSGQVFEIEAGDTIDTALWLPVDDVIVCEIGESAFEIINTDENREKASAKRLGTKYSAGNPLSAHLPPGFVAQSPKGSAQGSEYNDLIPKQQTKRNGEYDDLLPQQGQTRPPGPIDPSNMARQEAAQPQAATTSAGADKATAPAPAEEQEAENARPVEVTPHPGNETSEAAAPAALASPAKAPFGALLTTIEDLPQYKFAREFEHAPIAVGNPETRYLTIIYGMIKSRLRETPELHIDSANERGVVGFYLGKRGNLVGRKLVSSSGSPSLDMAVMTAIAEAAPYPAPPNRRTLYLNYNFGKRGEPDSTTR
jgi:outer membrane biosynthesis protein TonB